MRFFVLALVICVTGALAGGCRRQEVHSRETSRAPHSSGQYQPYIDEQPAVRQQPHDAFEPRGERTRIYQSPGTSGSAAPRPGSQMSPGEPPQQ